MNPKPLRLRAIRGVLNVAVLLGIAIALSPGLQHAYGWWSQRQLRAEFDASTRAASLHPKPRPARKPQSQPAKAPLKLKAKADSARLASAATIKKSKKSTSHRKARDEASAVTLSAQDDESGPEHEPLPATRLSIPEIGVDAVVVQGLDAKALARGPGHDPASALPGQSGNCVLAAHRNVYGSWFYNLDQLWGGSSIELKSGGQSFHYTVVALQTVSEADTSILRSKPGAPPSLTLITCTMPHSPYRLIATAYLQSE